MTTQALRAPALTVNGDVTPIGDVSVHTTVLDWLRDRGLTGAKEGCAEGECGACSILVARPGTSSATEWTAVNACLLPVASLDGQEVITSEGLGTTDALHPVQQEMAVRGGSQCGFCTPGFICSMAAEYYRPDRTAVGAGADGCATAAPLLPAGAAGGADHEHGPNGFDLHALSGNLCRCTGYRPIRDAAYALDEPTEDDTFAVRRNSPPPAPARTGMVSPEGEFIRPASLDHALAVLGEREDAVVVAGSTDLGVQVNIFGSRPQLTIAIDRLEELREFSFGADEVRLGAALTLTEIERRLDGRVPLLGQLFPQFASRLIRNGATIGGNLGTGSPIGDTPPALLALDAKLVLASSRRERVVALAEYFTGYRQTVKAPDELIRTIIIPLPLAPITAFHKIAKRRFDDISSVAVGYALDVADGVVRDVKIGLGGVAATPLRATATEAALIGQPWNETTVRTAAAVMASEGTPMDDHRASSSYRSAMLGQSLLRFYFKGVEA
ncbi:FAD binding domain-containing protein [Kribbella jejuensis]|uniref:Xanthine dehydrogenase small subunit n=1 Tax=Kribbella jejuensis TaxID=236068 RepID=A0A542EVA5_9ACTN|nr:FAD binding domain-containing protein [Kribbella jejuensis]TQJ19281.1 xanthine dehydrogenase small subunit [Kribbella jejuensis]